MMSNPREALRLVPKGPNSFLNGRNFTGKQILHRFDKVVDEGVHLHDAVLPDLPKIVRLAFHDCLQDSETGGCNGYFLSYILIIYLNYSNFMKYIYFQMTMEGMTQVTNAKIQR